MSGYSLKMEGQIGNNNGTMGTSLMDGPISPVPCSGEIFDRSAITSDNKTIDINRAIISVTEITPVRKITPVTSVAEIDSVTEKTCEMETEITPIEIIPVEGRVSNNQLQSTIEKPKGSSASLNQVTFVSVCPYVTLVVVIILVIGIMLIPSILYFTSLPSEDAALSNFNLLDYKNCLVAIDLGVQNTVFELCQAKLNQSMNNCGDNLMITELGLVYNAASKLGNSQCTENALSFFCNATYSLCDDDNALSLSEECVQVRDDNCAAEWRIVDNLLNASSLDCGTFQTANDSFVPTLMCPDNFETVCNSLCLPSCGFTVHSDAVTIVYRVLLSFSFIFLLIGGVITLIASVIKREKMFKFPLIFVVYTTVAVLIIACAAVLSSIFGPKYFLCNDNLVVTREESTTFCQGQGFFVQVGITLFSLFWMFHVFHVFASLAFPFKADRLLKSNSYKRRVHIAEFSLILLFGFVPNIVTLSTSGYQYSGMTLICYPTSTTVFFYTLVFPATLGSMLSSCFLFGSFWILRKNSKMESATNKKHKLLKLVFTGLKTSEFKLWVLFLYYWITILIRAIFNAVLLRNMDHISQYLSDYIICSFGGYRDECGVFKEQLQNEGALWLVMDCVSILLLSFVNLFNLFFVIQLSDVKAFLKKLFSR